MIEKNYKLNSFKLFSYINEKKVIGVVGIFSRNHRQKFITVAARTVFYTLNFTFSIFY